MDDDVFNTRVIVGNIEGTMNVNSSQLEELVRARGETDVIINGQNVKLAVKDAIQKKLVDQYKNVIASANNIRKGNFGEIATDVDLTTKGYSPLHINRVTDIDAPTHQGIDGVFVKDGQYYIVEAKYHGQATLNPANPATNLPKQMSDAWIRQNNYKRLRDAVGNDLSEEIRSVGYKRLLSETAPDGTVLYKELDMNASIIGNFNP